MSLFFVPSLAPATMSGHAYEHGTDGVTGVSCQLKISSEVHLNLDVSEHLEGNLIELGGQD
jgi:hypothetical protein